MSDPGATYNVTINLPGAPGSDLAATLTSLEASMSDISARITNLQAEVAQQAQVNQSAITLLNGIVTELQAARDDIAARGVTDDQLAALDTTIASYSDQTDALAAAVAEGTPAEPA